MLENLQGDVTVITGVAILVGLLGTVVPILPGGALIAGAIGVWALVVQSAAGWLAFAAAVVLGSAVWLMIVSFDALWSLALDDLDTADWLANLGISLFALPLVVLGSVLVTRRPAAREGDRVAPATVAQACVGSPGDPAAP